MGKVIVLGGAGAVGSVAAKALANNDSATEVIVADLRGENAEATVKEIGSPKAKPLVLDVLDEAALKQAIGDVDVILNCSGPFYKLVKPVLQAAIDLKKQYIDVCDDVDVTEEILTWDEKAKAAGIIAAIGVGASPGVTNLMAMFAAKTQLDQTLTIDIYHAHGGEPVEGEGVIAHRFHCMSIDVPMYLDGKLKYVKFFEPDGEALQEEVVFYRLGDTPVRCYPYPHPEQLTLPNYIDCNRVTNKGAVMPAEYYNLTKELCRDGLASKEPLEVKGQTVTPYDFAIAYILRERERILKETNFGTQRGATKIVVMGKKDGQDKTVIFHIPAAMGTILMLRGGLDARGVLPPEGCIDPMALLALLPEVTKTDSGGKGFDGIKIDIIDHEGNVSSMDLA